MQNPFTQMMQAANMMRNPGQTINNLMQNNPNMRRAMEMSEGKSPEQIQQVCRNLCDQMGVNYTDALNQFQSISAQFGIKI